MSTLDSGDCFGESVAVGSSVVTVSDKIDSGTEGSVYKIRENDKVVKIFNESRRADKEGKVRAMIDNNPDHESIIWPQRSAEHTATGEFLGYVMPYKDTDTTSNAFEYALTELGWESSEQPHRFTVAKNLATMVDAIHSEGHAVGDFNHDNILIDSRGHVTLIDCDGFHITDKTNTYPDDTYYPRYAPPEGRGGDTLSKVKEADRFCLGVHIFQFLMEGFHPYHAQGSKAVDGSMEDKLKNNKFPYVGYSGYQPIDSAPEIDAYKSELPDQVRTLFKRCFTESGKNKTEQILTGATSPDRPEPQEWKAAIGASRKDGDSGSDTGDAGLDVVTPDTQQQSGRASDTKGGEGGLDPVVPDSTDGTAAQTDGISPVTPGEDERTEQAETEDSSGDDDT